MSNRFALATLLVTVIILTVLFPGFVWAEVYTLGVGDGLQISVWGHNELSTAVEVRPDGFITFPLVGDLQAVGKTTQELAAEIQQKLRSYVIDPHVTVLVREFRTVSVQVLGEVKTPGYYQVRAGARLLDVLGLAGGPTKAADLSQVSITRQTLSGGSSAEVQRVDVNEYIEQGTLAANPVLEHGDVIRVEAVGKALVLGEVRYPASYDIGPEMDILDLIAQAGGALDSADLEQVVLTRTLQNGQASELLVNVQALLSGRVESAPLIQRNDVVFVPARAQVIILGAVRSPGTYPLKKGARLLDVVASAGGLTDRADARRISVTRTGQEEQEIFEIDAHNALLGRVGGENPVLVGGDIVFVPEGKNLALVLGQVLRPGSYPVTESTRALEVIAEAGGLTAQAAADRVMLTRTTGEEVELVQLDLAMVQQGRQANPIIQPGDVLFVPEGAPQVLVLGQVRSPGSYRLTETTRILDVIAMAGGATDKAGQKLTLTRGGSTKEIDLGALTRLGLGNERLQAGDVLHIAEGQQQVLILGEVRSPGYYRFNIGDRVLDAVGYAGGLLPQAASDEATLTRQSDGQTEIVQLDLAELMENRFLSNNLQLQAGDIIIVPKANRSVLVLGEVRSPGYYSITGQERVLDLVAMAGGLTDAASGDSVTLTRHREDGTEEVLTINADAAMRGTSGLRDADNPQVFGGDVIFVPERQTRVLVFGEVRSPGYYAVTGQERLLDLLAMAGGLTDAGQGEAVTLTRLLADGTEEVLTINADAAMRGAGGLNDADNPQVFGGDVIFVPERQTRVLVFGEVRSPGYYPITGKERLLDLLAMAGGLTDAGQGDAVTLTRLLSDGTEEVLTINAEAAMRGAGGLRDADNPVVVGGDVIFVPERQTRVLVFGEVRSPGYYAVDSQTRLLDVIARAGGLTELADGTSAVLTREVEGVAVTEVIDVQRAMLTGEGNYLLAGGETLLVPRLVRTVVVFGEVARPGSYPAETGDRLTDILAKAGGPLQSADLSQVTLTTRAGSDHDGAVSVLNLEPAMLDANDVSNRLVMGGETIYVPKGNRQVLVLGEVLRPGAFTVDQNTRILDLLALAGGPTDAADLNQATLTRIVPGGEAVTPVNLNAVLANEAENIALQGGDILYLPRARQVLVMGEVSRPGSFTLPPGGRILDLLALAGGLSSNYPSQEVIMTRQEGEAERVWHMYYGELMSSQAEYNLLLAGGDVIYVPESRRQVLVLGEVRSPGVYNIPVGARVLDAIALAGGPTDRAALENVGIYRGGSADDPTTLTMGRDKLLFEGDVKENPLIQGGDVIYVPETKKPNWTAIFSFMGGLKTFKDLLGI